MCVRVCVCVCVCACVRVCVCVCAARAESERRTDPALLWGLWSLWRGSIAPGLVLLLLSASGQTRFPSSAVAEGSAQEIHASEREREREGESVRRRQLRKRPLSLSPALLHAGMRDAAACTRANYVVEKRVRGALRNCKGESWCREDAAAQGRGLEIACGEGLAPCSRAFPALPRFFRFSLFYKAL